MTDKYYRKARKNEELKKGKRKKKGIKKEHQADEKQR